MPLAQSLPHRVAAPDVRRWHAWMLLDRRAAGDVVRARALIGEAIAAYRELGMPMHVAMCDAMLA